jgi:hypothetical protein
MKRQQTFDRVWDSMTGWLPGISFGRRSPKEESPVLLEQEALKTLPESRLRHLQPLLEDVHNLAMSTDEHGSIWFLFLYALLTANTVGVLGEFCR